MGFAYNFPADMEATLTDNATPQNGPEDMPHATIIRLIESGSLDTGDLPNLDLSNPAEVMRRQMALQKWKAQLRAAQEEVDRVHSELQQVLEQL